MKTRTGSPDAPSERRESCTYGPQNNNMASGRVPLKRVNPSVWPSADRLRTKKIHFPFVHSFSHVPQKGHASMAQYANAASAHIREAFPDRSHTTHVHTHTGICIIHDIQLARSRAYNRRAYTPKVKYARTLWRGLLRFSRPAELAGQMFHSRSVNNAARVVRGAPRSRRYNANHGFPESDRRAPGFIDPRPRRAWRDFVGGRSLATLQILRIMRRHPWTLLFLGKNEGYKIKREYISIFPSII